MYTLDIERLATLVRTKRGGRGLREVAKEVGVSASTLSRVENSNAPDMESFALLCDWLGVQPSAFFSSSEPAQPKNVDVRIVAKTADDLDVAIRVFQKTFGTKIQFTPRTKPGREGQWLGYGILLLKED